MPKGVLADVDYHDGVIPAPTGAPSASAPGPEEVRSPVRPYEVMIIFDAGLEEDAIRAALDRYTELVRSRGGAPGRIDRWGRRRFAYELKHRSEGYYVVLEANAEPAVMSELDRALFLADEVIRHKVIRLPDHRAGQRATAEPAVEVGAPASPEANGE